VTDRLDVARAWRQAALNLSKLQQGGGQTLQ
jgi:hypothetical protein